jgi:hypothetical protein
MFLMTSLSVLLLISASKKILKIKHSCKIKEHADFLAVLRALFVY